MGYWSIAGLPPVLNLLVPIYTHGWRQHCKSRLSCPRTQHSVLALVEPGLLHPETNELTMSPPKRTDMYFLTHNRRQMIYQIQCVVLRRVEESKILSLDHFYELELKEGSKSFDDFMHTKESLEPGWQIQRGVKITFHNSRETKPAYHVSRKQKMALFDTN